jgi:predicted dehydrogenase
MGEMMSIPEPLRVAIVGCGNISSGYANSLKTRPEKVALLGATDVDPTRARDIVQSHGGVAYPDLTAALSDTRVEAIINLTAHHAHAEVTAAALEAGKHVHSEKPLAGTLEDGRRCVELAERKGLRLSCSPFTFMGEAQQTLLRAKQEGVVGRVLAAYSEMNWGRIESWHPNPEGFYQLGSGPLLDVGVYALTVLTTVLGRVRRVTGSAAIVMPERTIARGPNAGKKFQVSTPDQVVGGLEFEEGALGRLTASFVVRGTKQAAGTELHGEIGSLFLSSNHDFNGRVERFSNESGEWSVLPYVAPPFQGVEWGRAVFELADSLRTGAIQHCTGQHALHVLEICLGILRSAEEGRPVEIESPFTPPAPLEHN